LVYKQDNLSARDGIKLYVQSWEPETESRGVVCLVHGLGEHSGRYLHLAEFLSHENYTLFAFDLRGHGKSQGKRGHTPSISVLFDDIDQVLSESILRYNGKPHFLYGHSLGGLLVIAYAIQYHPQITGIISTGPIFRTAFKPPIWKTSLGRLIRGILPAFAMNNEVDPHVLSHDQQIVRAYVDDPLVHDRISARLGIDMLDLGIWALEHASEVNTPLFLMHAGDDRLCSVEASQEFAARAGEICTLKIWEGLYHEIHNEPEKNLVFNTALAWLDGKCSKI